MGVEMDEAIGTVAHGRGTCRPNARRTTRVSFGHMWITHTMFPRPEGLTPHACDHTAESYTRNPRREQAADTGAMRLSYSSINTYETCPAKFRFQYEDQVPQRAPRPPSPSATRCTGPCTGSTTAPSRSPPPLAELQEHARGLRGSPTGSRASPRSRCTATTDAQVLAQYHRENASEYRIPAALEFRSDRGGGVALSGVIDRMDRLPGGGYEIIDYKTNRRLPPKARIDAGPPALGLPPRGEGGLGHRARAAHPLLPAARPADDDDADRRGRRPAASADRDGRRAHRRPASSSRGRTRLCDWCEYQAPVPVFRHRSEQEQGDPAPRMTELVDEWIALKRQRTRGLRSGSTSSTR